MTRQFERLKAAGVQHILNDAALLIERFGLNKGSAIHRVSGKVDIWGAIAVAAGADPRKVQDDILQADNYVPRASVGRAIAAYDLITSAVGSDAATWGDDLEDKAVVVSLLRNLAQQVELAVDLNE